MTYEQQLAKVRATLAQKRKAMGDIMTKAVGENRTPNDEEETQIAQIEDDIKALEKNEARIEGIIKAVAAAQNLTAVAGETPEQAAASAEGAPIPDATPTTVQNNMDKGVGFALLVKASAIATKSKGGTTTREVLQSWGSPEHIIKAAQEQALAGTTTDEKFGKSLVEYGNLTSEFLELVRQKTIVDKIASQMRQVPFNVNIPMQTAAGSVGWVGEGKMKPVGNPEFGSIKMDHSKIAGIVLLSDELIRFSNPKADALVRDDLVHSVAQFIDQQFFDPTKDESPESPASILHGVEKIVATGTTADKIDADLNTLIAKVVDAGISLEGAVWGMSETRAMQISGLRDALGRPYFEGMSLIGSRSLKGLPVHTSGNLANKIVLMVPGLILIADDGGVDFSISNEATINMGTDDAPKLINLFQNNFTAVRAERFIRWRKRVAEAAGYIEYQ